MEIKVVDLIIIQIIKVFTNHNLNIKPAFPVDGDGYEYNQRQDDDNYFEQPGKLFRLQSDDAKERIFTNTKKCNGWCE